MSRTTNDSLVHRTTASSGILYAPGLRPQAWDPASQAAPYSRARGLYDTLCSGARASAAVETPEADGWQSPKPEAYPLQSQPGSLQLQDFFLHLGMEGEEGRTTLLPAGKYSTDLVCEHNDRQNDLTSLT